jgi:hypothetical protein
VTVEQMQLMQSQLEAKMLEQKIEALQQEKINELNILKHSLEEEKEIRKPCSVQSKNRMLSGQD